MCSVLYRAVYGQGHMSEYTHGASVYVWRVLLLAAVLAAQQETHYAHMPLPTPLLGVPTSPCPTPPHPSCPSPRAMRKTRIMRMMVGLMGNAALISISSSVMPMTDSSTMARSSWFHLLSRAEEGKSGRQG